MIIYKNNDINLKINIMKKELIKPRKANKKLSELLLSNIKTIADGITSEKLSPIFFDATKLKYQPEPLYRLDSNNHRYYYRFDENGEPRFFTSVTTMIKNTLPTSPQLIQWIASMGAEESKEFTQERADYGTFLHIQCSELLINGTYDLDTLSQKLDIFVKKEKIVIKKGWVEDLKKDVLAFAQFIIDINCKPLAIEIGLYHPISGYAGTIDIVCEIDIEEKGFFGETYKTGVNAGQPKESKRIKRIRAIIDIKSGRKGFYESSEIQLKAYEAMWNIYFPELPIDKVYNWSPKDWRSAPSYNLKDQTDSKNAKKLPYLIALAKIEDEKRTNSVTVIKGKIDLLKGLTANIEELTFIELIKKNK
jgi:hypothetical protein